MVYLLSVYRYNDSAGRIRMRYSTKTAAAAHLLTNIIYFGDKENLTSDFLAASINTNPVIVRKIFQQLKEAGLITVRKGTGGASLAKDPADISLLDIYVAVEDPEEPLFHIHNPNTKCPVGRNITGVLSSAFAKAQSTMEADLSHVSLKDIAADVCTRIKEEQTDQK